MKAADWLAAVHLAAEHYFPDQPLQIQIIRETRVKIRIEIGEELFADLFFREETGRTDYALIHRGQRCFGIDNLGGWHEHPLESPDSHITTTEPSPEQAVQRLRQAAGETGQIRNGR